MCYMSYYGMAIDDHMVIKIEVIYEYYTILNTVPVPIKRVDKETLGLRQTKSKIPYSSNMNVSDDII